MKGPMDSDKCHLIIICNFSIGKKTDTCWREKNYTDDSDFGDVTIVAMAIFAYSELLFGMK